MKYSGIDLPAGLEVKSPRFRSVGALIGWGSIMGRCPMLMLAPLWGWTTIVY